MADFLTRGTIRDLQILVSLIILLTFYSTASHQTHSSLCRFCREVTSPKATDGRLKLSLSNSDHSCETPFKPRHCASEARKFPRGEWKVIWPQLEIPHGTREARDSEALPTSNQASVCPSKSSAPFPRRDRKKKRRNLEQNPVLASLR